MLLSTAYIICEGSGCGGKHEDEYSSSGDNNDSKNDNKM